MIRYIKLANDKKRDAEITFRSLILKLLLIGLALKMREARQHSDIGVGVLIDHRTNALGMIEIGNTKREA